MELDFNATYTVARWPKVAVRVCGYPKVWVAYSDYDECDLNDGEFEDDIESGDVLVYMVGDDFQHRVPISSLTKIDELDYCACCGQIGCQWDGRDRDE